MNIIWTNYENGRMVVSRNCRSEGWSQYEVVFTDPDTSSAEAVEMLLVMLEYDPAIPYFLERKPTTGGGWWFLHTFIHHAYIHKYLPNVYVGQLNTRELTLRDHRNCGD